MRVVIGDCFFEATGEPEWVHGLYRKWSEAVRKHFRRPVEDRIALLQAELREQRRLLKRMDAEYKTAIPSDLQ